MHRLSPQPRRESQVSRTSVWIRTHVRSKRGYANLGITFDILAIVLEPGRGYEGRDRWAITVKAIDRDEQTLSLGSNPGRDEELRAAQDHLKNGGTITNKRLRLKDGAYYINDGDR